MMGWQETASYAAVFIATELSRYIVFALVWSAVILLGWRWAASRKIQPKPFRRKDMLRDFRTSVVAIVVFGLVGVVTVQLMSLGLLQWHDGQYGLWMFLLGAFVTAVAHDTYFYWTHRWMHHRRLFRTFHYTHHLAKSPSVWTSYNLSIPEAVVQAAFIPIWFLIMPMNGWLVFFFFVHQLGRNVTGHAGYEFAWPGFSRGWITRWITTATHHDLHHSEGRHNFGIYFTWWDKLMGTEHPQYHERFEANARPFFSIGAPRESDNVSASNH